MRKIILSGFLAISAIAASHHAHWSYKGENGPSHWGELNKKFFMCEKGVNQSPVNLNRFVESNLQKPKVKYSGHAETVVNNGHTIKVNVKGPDWIEIDGKKFNLLQFHFYTPSENKIEGKSFPMEAHFVHKSKDGEYLVISLMFKEGKENKALQKILNDLDPKVGHEKQLKEMFNPGEFFPKKLDYFRYDGSFTTPPCTEGVRWIVLKNNIEASKEQIEKMHKIMGNNNRPIQPLKARVILK